MRLPVLLTAALLLTACQPPAATPGADAPAARAEALPVVMPADAPPQEEAPAEAGSAACSVERGADAARLVERCIAVSPATHPPCNVQNPCQMIQDEIDRACGQYGPAEARPSECAA